MVDPGAILGGYRLLRVIGRGAMATVYEAIQIRLRRRVALKCLHSEFTADPKVVRRFLREAETAGALQHPGIVTVHDRGQEGSVPYIVMELIEGPTLDEVVRRTRDGPPVTDGETAPLGAYPGPETSVEDRIEFAVDVGIQIAEALQVAHERDVVHRDVKPSNILLADGQAKISDFGLAGVRDDAHLTATHERIGTPAYMSPEQALGRDVDARSDVYSLGASVYEVLTLRRSIEGRSLQDFFHRIPVEDPKPARKLVSAIPKDLETIIAKTMRKEPDRRYATATALADDLRRYRRGESVAARPDGPIRKVWRAGRRHPVWRLGILSLLFAIVAAFALWQLWPGDPNLAHITVLAHGGGEYPVSAIPLDDVGDPLYADVRRLGSTPLEDAPLPSGAYRLVVGTEAAFAEVLIEVEPRERKTIDEFRVLPTNRVHAGMKHVPTGDYELPRASSTTRNGHQRVKGFWIDEREVTNAEFDRFLDESGDPDGVRNVRAWWKIPEEPARVTWFQADLYTRWVGKRLPITDEWRAAFVGPENRPPTTGNIETNLVRPVGTSESDVTTLGLLDMLGNVCEWTATWWVRMRDPIGSSPPTQRTIIGHSMIRGTAERPRHTQLAENESPNERLYHIGFRCVKSEWPADTTGR